MIIINSYDKFEKYLKSFNDDVIIIPIFIDKNQHYLNNKLSLLYIEKCKSNDFYLVIFNHSESNSSIDLNILNDFNFNRMFVIDKKEFLPIKNFNNLYDIKLYHYLNTGNIIEFLETTSAHSFVYRMGGNNSLIPLVKHVEILRKKTEKIKEIIGTFANTKAYNFYNSLIINNLFNLEKPGIRIDKKLLVKRYGKDVEKFVINSLIFPQYNLFTLTGRPSNKFANINFSALNKKDGTRKIFICRNDIFILFDYDSFHLNLVKSLLKFNVEYKNIHNYLGELYFNKKSLTEKEYEESKAITFRYLYGNAPDNIRDEIPFFKEVYSFSEKLWKKINENGFIKSPISERQIFLNKIIKPKPSKIFNYFIQLIEFETTSIILNNIYKKLEGLKTKLVLYTYDSFLFDYSKDDGLELTKGIHNIIENNIFTTKIFTGKNYHELKQIKV